MLPEKTICSRKARRLRVTVVKYDMRCIAPRNDGKDSMRFRMTRNEL